MKRYELLFVYDGNNYSCTGEILTGWPARLNPKDFRFSAVHNVG